MIAALARDVQLQTLTSVVQLSERLAREKLDEVDHDKDLLKQLGTLGMDKLMDPDNELQMLEIIRECAQQCTAADALILLVQSYLSGDLPMQR